MVIKRLFSVVVFFFVYSPIYSQSKKEQIDIISAQRDSLVKVVSLKEAQITTLTELNQSQSAVVKEAKKKNLSLSEQLHQKDELINELTKSQKCISAETEVSIEVSEGLEPSLIKLSYWNGFILKVVQEGENETYPNRLYGFRYGITDVNAELPVGCLFNEKRDVLEKRLNELMKLELASAGISSSQIIHYYFPVKDHDSGEGTIMLFIDHDIATFYFEQYMYGINDRREIEIPLSELNEYLIDLKDLNKEERRKFCSKFNMPILIQVLLKNVEEGDAGYYLEFVDPIHGEIFPFSFAEWQFKDQMIEEFCEKYWRNEVALEKKFMIEFQWSKIKQYEYRGFEEGNVETGKTIDAWTLVSIYPGWTE